ncbi:flagellar motor switch protein FliN [Aquipuribacter hungaricus]|uniref:Flagellar motor switch protein FliN n=1 Tax=Aquipuribacter hungaricus TaxID=545624 RepID=A0ABV7WI51_9MICO
MTSSPTARTTDSTTAPALAAASAAAAVLPLGGPVAPVTAPLSELDGLDSHVAVTARFSGAVDGTVAVVLSAGDLLALSGGETVDPECCRPALEAASTALGPCVLSALDTVSAPTLLQTLREAGERAHLARLGDDPADAVHVVVVVADAPAPPAEVPTPRRSPADGGTGSGTTVTPPAGGRGVSAGDIARGMGMLRGVHMEVTAEIGRTRMTVQELLELAAGSVVELDRPVGSPADLLVNGRLFARGEVVVVDEDFALRITEIVEPDDAG